MLFMLAGIKERLIDFLNSLIDNPQIKIVMKVVFDKIHESRRLVIKECKSCLYGVITDLQGNELMSARFYYKDGDATIYRVKEYYNFNQNN
ncbi:hypothetical protein K220099C10_19760 [Bacteroides thetaiotaomicron]